MGVCVGTGVAVGTRVGVATNVGVAVGGTGVLVAVGTGGGVLVAAGLGSGTGVAATRKKLPPTNTTRAAARAG